MFVCVCDERIAFISATKTTLYLVTVSETYEFFFFQVLYQLLTSEKLVIY